MALMLESREETSYRENSEKSRQLFSVLLEKSRRGEYDDGFLAVLVDYQVLFPASENFDIFYARYALAHGNAAVALEAAQKAYAKKKYHYEVWKILIECYKRLGDMRNLLIIEGVASRVYRIPIDVPIERAKLKDSLDLLSLAMGTPMHAPYVIGRAHLGENGLEALPGAFVGEFLPSFAETYGDYRYWSGIFVDMSTLDAKASLFERLRNEPALVASAEELIFDVMKSKQVEAQTVVDVPGAGDSKAAGRQDIIVPLAGTETGQKIRFRNPSVDEISMRLGKWAYSFFRLGERTEIESAAPFIVGKPIRLGHSPRRRKLVLHLLVDALCWPAMKKYHFEQMPNLMRFFSKGVIFNNNFSVAEYTYPSLATIETGLYPHHSQMFNSTCMGELSPSLLTLSEQMERLGYYCVNVWGDSSGIYNGATRGYDRLLLNPGGTGLYAYRGVQYAIETMRAFAECDQFLFLHVQDAHPATSANWQMPLATQTLLPLLERLDKTPEDVPSVDRVRSPLYVDAILEGMWRVDRSLGELFSYIEENYEEDEYVVQVYSDHGGAVFNDTIDYISESLTGTVWMLRGAGVPQKGFVDEMTSILDIYPTAAHLAGFAPPDDLDGSLPQVFGGAGREHTVSYSLFPGKPYRMAVRTKTHEFRLESEEIVDEDGSVDLRRPRQQLFCRGEERREIRDDALQQSFLALAREYTAAMDTRGEVWPEKRALRASWFGNEGTGGER